MTATKTWTIAGLAVIALAVGALLATGAIGSAQEGTATPTPSTTDEPVDDTSTPTPSATDDATDEATPTPEADEATPAPEDDADSEDDGESSQRGCSGAKSLIVENAAEILDMTEEELREAKQSDQSLADVAVAQGMTVEDFTAQLDTAVRTDLQAQLTVGEITQEKFDEITAELDENLDEIVNSTRGAHFRGTGDPEGDATKGARFGAPFQEAPTGADA